MGDALIRESESADPQNGQKFTKTNHSVLTDSLRLAYILKRQQSRWTQPIQRSILGGYVRAAVFDHL
jgi:hypothetical protein